MALKTKVKAGNITNLSDARYCAGMGVDWLSFPGGIVNPVIFKEITDWVTGPEFILEVNETTTLPFIEQFPVNSIEIPYSQMSLIELLPTKTWFVNMPLTAWTSIKNELIRYKDKISYVVLSLDDSNLHALEDVASHFKVLANLSEKYPIDKVITLPIEGINVAGENELKPGLKDFEKLASILEELEVID